MKSFSEMTPYELGESGDSRAVNILIGYLQSDTYNEKRLAASALSKLHKKYRINITPAKSYLLINCKDPKPQIRQYSLKTINRIKSSLTSNDIEFLKEVRQLETKDYNVILLDTIFNYWSKNRVNNTREVPRIPLSDPGQLDSNNSFENSSLSPLADQRTITILAKSRKYGGLCIAGKQLTGNQKWVRPVSNHEHGELSQNNIQINSSGYANILDIVSIPIIQEVPDTYQSENIQIDETKPWRKRGKLEPKQLEALCDQVSSLWVNQYSSSNGIYDRIPAHLADRLTTSLSLIKANNLKIIIQNEYGKKKIRARFIYNRVRYQLMVTDCEVERLYKNKNIGTYPIDNEPLFLCISLGELFEGYCYKLVAALISV